MHSIAGTDDIGGLWAVIATIFVLRGSYEQSVAAAISRVAGTLVSFAVCVAIPVAASGDKGHIGLAADARHLPRWL